MKHPRTKHIDAVCLKRQCGVSNGIEPAHARRYVIRDNGVASSQPIKANASPWQLVRIIIF
jgi:hypothetical protein